MRSVRTKLWIWIMALIAIIFVLLWMFQIVFLEKFYLTLELGTVTKNINQIVNEINNLNSLTEIRESTYIMEEMDTLIYEKQLSLVIIDSSFNNVYQASYGSGSNMPGAMKEPVAKAEESALKGTVYREKVIHPKFNYHFMIYGVPVYKGEYISGAMIAIIPLASVEETKQILKTQLLIIVSILFVVSIVTAFILARSFTNPILQISNMAETYAYGNFEKRIENSRNDEIGQLAKRMNEMGEALVRNEVLQKELIANVSHELRTPLSLIRGYAEIIRDVTGDNQEKREKQIGIIIEETQRLSEIVEDILSLSQMQSGTIILECEKFYLSEMLYQMKERFELQQEKRELNIYSLIKEEAAVVGDKKRIQQVFYNLIANAFSHSPETENVEIRISETESRIKIEVIDQGEGIAKEDLGHVFERYYKGKSVNGKKHSGTGLGLAIVKSILEMHQSAYGVESELGKGTIFWFVLNKADSHTSF
ncbi:sensor histidine kinase [Anaeromicropila populeti]|uniref:histidine kinase n=1 Tax=Anaeromicropila populeti TaxID=37658 RepID=A0A1I6KRN7_9FIRM|nr:ATP-binding protein [Anaeromicropila populeti]SFR93580.1 Signal transduction histidine kinase [Anaeromicropila populeti]